MTTDSTPRYAGLDGLRAIAVLVVVGYHLFPAWVLQSGFVGVDAFFVISGFLITSLLLREREASGRIALGAFWIRRARRLIPALVALVAVSATAAWVVGGDVLFDLGRQIVGAATFSYNWVAIADGASYFSAAEPELFRNLWSLAVEEQFYVLWPLVLPVLLLVRSRRGRVAIALMLAGASVTWGVVLTAGTISDKGALTRAYYGTDSHAFGLLIGVALALWLARPPAPGTAPTARRTAAASLSVGFGTLAALLLVAAWPSGSALYPGIPLAASILTALVIAIAVRAGSRFGRALDVAPLRWIGQRSYGIYLWHWPVVVLIGIATTGSFVDSAIPIAVGIAALVVTVATAALSYRLLEQPVRTVGFLGALRTIGARLSSSPQRRFGTLATIAATVMLVCGTGAAVVSAPTVSSSEAVVQAGVDALARAAAATPTARADGGAVGGVGGADASGVADASGSEVAACPPSPGRPGADCAGPDGRPVPPATVSVPGDHISAIGDSVMLASAGALLDAMPGIDIDAAVSRSMWAGAEIATDLSAQGALRDVVIVGLGTNGPVDDRALQQLYDAIGPDRTLVLVTAFAPRDWIDGVNTELASFAAAHARVVVADWSQAIAPHLDDLAGDRIHPGPQGGQLYADAVSAAVNDEANQRAQQQYEAELAEWKATRPLDPRP